MPLKTWRQLLQENMARQQGVAANNAQTNAGNAWDLYGGLDPNDEKAQAAIDRRVREHFGVGEFAPSPAALADAYNVATLAAAQQLNEDQATVLGTGYGTGSNDYEIPFNEYIENPIDSRAATQSSFEQLLHGAGKMGVTAATTFLDNTVGLVWGIAAGIDEMQNPKAEDERSPFWQGFINNKFSNAMQAVRDWSEEALPNYRTTEELEDQDRWWRHMNANFWGDVFIKNLGFTIGAGASGAAYARGLQAVAGKIMRNGYKAAVAAAAGDKQAEAALQSVMRGKAIANPEAIVPEFEKVLHNSKAMGMANAIIGGMGGAIGESRTEALMAARELRDSERELALAEYDRDMTAARQAVVENSNNYTFEPVYDNYGNKVGKRPVLKPEVETALQEKEQELLANYQQRMQVVEREAESVANRTFGLNMPLLSLSNMVMFGRMLSGGYGTQKNLFRGTPGSYTGRGSIGMSIAKGIGNTMTEGLEELSQKIISEGAKSVASNAVGAYTNAAYDKAATEETAKWLSGIVNNMPNVLRDPMSWQEFAIGALTGGLGRPSVRGGYHWEGGLYGEIAEGIRERSANRALADAVNERVKSQEFQELWKGLVRHNAYESAKNVDLSDSNQFAWHTDNHKQLISDIMMFANAGRLNDLEQMVDSFANVTDREIIENNDLLSDANDKDFANKTVEAKQAWLKKRANEVKEGIRQYRDAREAISFAANGEISEDALDELVFTHAQLKDFEQRYATLYKQVSNELKPTLERIANEKTNTDTPTKRAEKAQAFLRDDFRLATLFGGMAQNLRAERGTSTDEAETASIELDDKTQQDVLDRLSDLGAFTEKPQLKESIQDLQKLVRNRQEFYGRLFDPKRREGVLLELQQTAETPESATEEIRKEERIQKIQEHIDNLKQANTVQEYFDKRNRIDFAGDTAMEDELDRAVQDDPKLKRFEDEIQKTAEFTQGLSEAVAKMSERAGSPEEITTAAALSELFNNLPFEDIISSSAPGSSPMLEVAKALIDAAPTPQVEAALRKLIEEELGDIAKVNGLGTLGGNGLSGGAGSGEGAGEDGGTGSGSGGGISTFQHLSELIEKIGDINDSTLKKLASGDFTGYDDLTDEEKINLQIIATQHLAELREAAGLNGLNPSGGADPVLRDSLGTDDVEADSDPRKQIAKEAYKKLDTTSLNGMHFSVYDVGALKKGQKKPYSNARASAGVKATISWFNRHNVQDFIDSGALNELEQHYRNTGTDERSKHVPVYFIANPHFVPDNIETNPFVTKSASKKYPVSCETLLAVEIDDTARGIIEKYDKAGYSFLSDDSLITIDGKKYQVIGEVWNPNQKELASMPAEDRPAYENVKAEAQKVWDWAVAKSILPQYKSEYDRNSSSFTNEGKWYVGKLHPTTDTEVTDTHAADWSTGRRLYTTLNYMSSGRNETRAVGSDEYEKIPIKDALKQYTKLGKKYYFLVNGGESNGIISSEGAPKPDAITPPDGSVWMATQEPDGNWSWTYLTVARAREFDFNADNPIANDIRQQLDIIFKPLDRNWSSEEKSADGTARGNACSRLSNIFFMGTGSRIRFAYSRTVLNNVDLYIGGIKCNTPDEAITALQAGNYRFQVDTNELFQSGSKQRETAAKQYADDLINSNVLLSEMRSFIRMGASFGVNFLVDKDADGRPVDPLPKVSEENAYNSLSNSSSRAALATGRNDIRIGDVGFRLEDDGTVYFMNTKFRTGEKVTNPLTVAQVKMLAELLNMKKGTNPASFSGNSWVATVKNFQYTELYEKVIDGYTIRVARNGKNGAFLLVYDDALWEGYLQNAKSTKPQFVQPEAPTLNVNNNAYKKLVRRLGSTADGGLASSYAATSEEFKNAFLAFEEIADEPDAPDDVRVSRAVEAYLTAMKEPENPAVLEIRAFLKEALGDAAPTEDSLAAPSSTASTPETTAAPAAPVAPTAPTSPTQPSAKAQTGDTSNLNRFTRRSRNRGGMPIGDAIKDENDKNAENNCD